LRFVDGQQAVDRLELEQDPGLDNDIDAVAAVNEHALVADGYGSLTLETHLAKPQLGAQANLVRRLQEPRTQRSVHFDDGTDNRFGPILKTSALPIFLVHILLSVAYASRGCVKNAPMRRDRASRQQVAADERDAEKNPYAGLLQNAAFGP
jgi:hypothetical protein